MSLFEPILNALPQPQRILWDELEGIPGDYVLYGGTALALRLGHRQSEDFDFFSAGSFEPDSLVVGMGFLRGGAVTQKSRNTLTCVVKRGGPVRVSFFGGLKLRRINDPDVCAQNGVQIASLLDLAGCKAEVVQHRAEAKDYRDIAALLNAGLSLEAILAAGGAVYGPGFASERTLRALTFFNDGNLPELDQNIRTQLVGAVAKVKLGALPELTARPGISRQEVP